jgi:Skp family chaperone for outer membrane proteins
MKLFPLTLVMFSFAVSMVTVHAQARLMTNANPKPAAQPPAAAAVIAVIDSGDFTDSKNGITRVTNALTQLNVKYDPIQKEIRGMQDRLTAMRADIQKKQATQAPNLTAQQTDQAANLELQIKRKAEDAQANYQKDMQAALTPLQGDIATALSAYAQKNGILLIIDANRVPLIYAHTSIDITKDFIADYNRTHPATGTAAPARP